MRISALKSILLFLTMCMLSACAKEDMEPKLPVYNTTVLSVNLKFSEQTMEYLDAVIELTGFDHTVKKESPSDLMWIGNTYVNASRTPASSSYQIKFYLKDGLTLPISMPEVSYTWEHTCVSTSTEGTIIGNAEIQEGEVHSITSELKTEQAVEMYLESLSKGFTFTVEKDGKITRKPI